MNTYIVTLGIAFYLVSASCSSASSPTQDTELLRRAALQQAAELAQQATPRKYHGDNAAALAKFEQARTILEKAPGDNRAELASNLDDIASIKARLGDFSAARQLYRSAQTQLEAIGSGRGHKLFDGISYRLRILDALERAGHVCREQNTFTPGTNGLPYFPEGRQVDEVLGHELNPLLQGCYEGSRTEIRVRLLLTGEGHLLLAETQGPRAGTPVGQCIEKRILQAASTLIDKLPKFAACFLPTSYPFVVASQAEWDKH